LLRKKARMWNLPITLSFANIKAAWNFNITYLTCFHGLVPCRRNNFSFIFQLLISDFSFLCSKTDVNCGWPGSDIQWGHTLLFYTVSRPV
jgi:hypothetical protein